MNPPLRLRNNQTLPFSWILVTCGSAALFGLAAVMSRPTWLKWYLGLCAVSSITWAMSEWGINREIRPLILGLEAMAVIEAICLMHENCWKPRRRYLCAAFCGLCAIAGTFAASEYPGYPKMLWWAQLWLEIGATAALAGALAIFGWWKAFRPAGWTIGNAVILMFYCAVHAGCWLLPISGTHNWVSIDIGLSLVQDACLLWWIVLYNRDV